MKKIFGTTFVCLTAATPLAFGAISGDFEINGFLSVGVAWSDVNYLPSGLEPVYLSSIRKQPSFDEDTNVGIQITKYLSDNISITTQLYAQGTEFFDVEATWAFLKWEPNDQWQFRAGRVRTDPYMLSDYVDVGYAYPWVRPPQEVYSQIPYSNFTGFDGRYKIVLFERDLSFSAFWGSSSNMLTLPANPPDNNIFNDVDFWLRHLYSFNIRYGDEVFSVRAGYETSRVTISPNVGSQAQALNTFLNTLVEAGIADPLYTNYFTANNSRAHFMGVGYQFDWKNVVSMGELVKRKSNTVIISDAIGWYLMGGYRVKEFLPHITFSRERAGNASSRRFPTEVNALAAMPPPFGFGSTLDAIAESIKGTSPYYTGGVGDQSSVTIGLRWDVYQGIALKAEYQHVHPDNGDPGLFNTNPHKSVNIYSFAVDAVM